MFKYYFLGLILLSLSGLPTLAQDTPLPRPPIPVVPAPYGFNVFKNAIPNGMRFTIKQAATCANTETFEQEVLRQYKEYSIFQGIAPTGRIITELYFNSRTASFTMALHFVSGNTCVLGSGKGIYQGPILEEVPTYYNSQ